METVRRVVLGICLCLHYAVPAVENALQCYDTIFQSSEVVVCLQLLFYLLVSLGLYFFFFGTVMMIKWLS